MKKILSAFKNMLKSMLPPELVARTYIYRALKNGTQRMSADEKSYIANRKAKNAQYSRTLKLPSGCVRIGAYFVNAPLPKNVRTNIPLVKSISWRRISIVCCYAVSASESGFFSLTLGGSFCIDRYQDLMAFRMGKERYVLIPHSEVDAHMDEIGLPLRYACSLLHFSEDVLMRTYAVRREDGGVEVRP